MIFGNTATFAVETGMVERLSHGNGLSIQFRFWVDSQAIGDWEDRIPLVASIENASTLCKSEIYRHERLFGTISPDDIFQAIYDGFFEYDYTIGPILIPNLRDRFHLDDIGMGAIQDRYGLVLVGSTNDSERIIAKDIGHNTYLADVLLRFGFVESALNAYIAWGRSQGSLQAD